MAENRRPSGRMDPEQLPLIDLHAPRGGEDMAMFVQVGTRLLMRMLTPRADPSVEAFIKNFDQTMMAGFTVLSTALKEVVRDVMRETIKPASPATPPATSPVWDEAPPTPVPRGLRRKGGAEGWRPIITAWVRTAVDRAAGGRHQRHAFVTDAMRQFQAVMRQGARSREAIIRPLQAQLSQPDVKRSRMTLHLPSYWQREITRWAKRLDRKLEPNQLLDIILRWRLHHIHDGHGRPSGHEDAPGLWQCR